MERCVAPFILTTTEGLPILPLYRMAQLFCVFKWRWTQVVHELERIALRMQFAFHRQDQRPNRIGARDAYWIAYNAANIDELNYFGDTPE